MVPLLTHNQNKYNDTTSKISEDILYRILIEEDISKTGSERARATERGERGRERHRTSKREGRYEEGRKIDRACLSM